MMIDIKFYVFMMEIITLKNVKAQNRNISWAIIINIIIIIIIIIIFRIINRTDKNE